MAVERAPITEHRAPPAPAPSAAARTPGAATVARRLVNLRAGGNRALARSLAAHNRLQRTGGWTGSSVAQNTGEGTFAGVRRIPVDGLTVVSRALVLLPAGFDPAKPADALVHLHGQNAGYDKGTPRDLDPGLDRIEEQMKAAGRTQLVAVLPQGSSPQADYGEFGKLDPRRYAREALDRVVALGALPAAPAIGGVVLSGHSGGGFAIKTILDDPARQKDLAGVVWFDAIQAEMGKPDARITTGQREAAKRLVHDRITAELDAIPAGATDPQLEAALGSGFRFRAYYDAAGAYAAAYGEVETYLKQLFGEAGKPPAGQAALAGRIAKLPPAARAALRSRYQTIAVKHTGDAAAHAANVAAGKLDTLGHDNVVGSNALADALGALPVAKPPPTPAPPAVPAPAPAPAPKSTALDADQDHEGVLAVARAPAGRLLRQVAVAEDVAARLIEETVALGRADGAPPGGGTLLRRDDIRAALTARANDPKLRGPFDGAVAVITAQPPGPARDLEYRNNASGLVMMLENAFIHDPARSTIDLLPPARAAHFRALQWGRYDYPGNAPGEPVGPLEGEARAMAAEIAALRPERRPNLGADAVIVQAEMTAARRARIVANLAPVNGQAGARLFAEAAAAFERMARIADFDGVELRILASWRDPAVAAANAQASGNPQAVAAFSSHSLGLAVDLAMSNGGQHFQEITTRPMDNVAAMRSAQAHKWLVLRGEQFGWFPFGNEPWHWEYNPPGFRQRFRQLVDPPAAPGPAPAS